MMYWTVCDEGSLSPIEGSTQSAEAHYHLQIWRVREQLALSAI